MRVSLTALTAILAGAAAAQDEPASPDQSPDRAANPDVVTSAEMIDADGQPVGTVEVRQLTHGTVFIADLQGLLPGPHGFHIHETGRCEPPDFQSAGGHYSPLEMVHGFDSPEGYHAGDLPNVHVREDGTALAEVHSTRVTLLPVEDARPTSEDGPFTLLDEDGSALMIHARGDDYQAQTEGSTGPRIACGVIAPPA